MNYNSHTLILNDSTSEQELESIRKDLENIGIQTEFEIREIHGIVMKLLRLEIPVKMKNERNAGRKRKNLGSVKTEMLEKEMKHLGSKEVAKIYGISQATIYRKLKEAKGNHDEWVN